MKSTVFALVLWFLLFPLSVTESQQQTAKLPVIGYLSNNFKPDLHDLAFLQGLKDRGYVHAKNVRVESRYAERNPKKLASFAQEFAKLPVDLIVTTGSLTTIVAKQATSKIPIVMIAVGDPLGTGLVANLARPGANITGSAALSPELSGKRLELLKDTFPGLSRVGVFWYVDNPASAMSMKETQRVAAALGLTLQSLAYRTQGDLEKLFYGPLQGNIDALLVSRGGVGWLRPRIIEFAAKHRLPAMYPLTEFADAGGLMAYGISNVELYRNASVYVDRIFRGDKPSDLPVEQTTKFEFVVNLRTAKQQGVTIPPQVLMDADRVIR